MPRLARTVFPNLPHHITQRGNRREDVFFTNDDGQIYLEWLQVYTEKLGVGVAAGYCLMANHIHLILVPPDENALHQVLKPLRMRYAQRLNRQRGQTGHVWQGRYFSSVLDGDYFHAALCYVERNPVRARIVRQATNYRWSSARGHSGLNEDPLLTSVGDWLRKLDDIKNWQAWLAEPEEPHKLNILRRNVEKGLPCGSERFIRGIEKRAGRLLTYKPQGRPRKTVN